MGLAYLFGAVALGYLTGWIFFPKQLQHVLSSLNAIAADYNSSYIDDDFEDISDSQKKK